MSRVNRIDGLVDVVSELLVLDAESERKCRSRQIETYRLCHKYPVHVCLWRRPLQHSPDGDGHADEAQEVDEAGDRSTVQGLAASLASIQYFWTDGILVYAPYHAAYQRRHYLANIKN